MEVSYKLSAKDYNYYISSDILKKYLSFKSWIKEIWHFLPVLIISNILCAIISSFYLSIVEKKNFFIFLINYVKAPIGLFTSDIFSLGIMVFVFIIFCFSIFIAMYFFGGHILRLDKVGFDITNLLASDYFIEKNYYGEEKIFWDKFTKIYQNNKLIILKCGQSKEYFIPKRAFNSPEEAEKFYQTALEYWENAKSAKPQAELPVSDNS